MPSCIRRGLITPLAVWLLLGFISACSQSPTQPNLMVEIALQPATNHLGLSLDQAYRMQQTKTSSTNPQMTSSLVQFYQIQQQLAPQESAFFQRQDAALAVTETYWELAIVNNALQQVWLEQKKLIPASSVQDAGQSLSASMSHTHLARLKLLASTGAQLARHKHKISQHLARLLGSRQTDFSLNYLPLSELRLRLPQAKSLLINEFARRLLKQHYNSTYAKLSAHNPSLKSHHVNQLYEQPILGAYVWQAIQSQLIDQAALLPTHSPQPQLARQLRLAQLNLALVKYHYHQQKMASIKAQYEANDSLYQLSQEQLLAGAINQQEVSSRSLEAMAMRLLYLQATLDTVHAYSQLLASSHLPPNAWQQPFNNLALANNNHEAMANIIDLAPASGSDNSLYSSDHLVSITGYPDKATQNSKKINNLALSKYLRRPRQNAIIASAALGYLWQVDFGDSESVEASQTILDQEPELAYLAHYLTASADPKAGAIDNKLTAVGLGHSQARALCERFKALNTECWLHQSAY